MGLSSGGEGGAPALPPCRPLPSLCLSCSLQPHDYGREQPQSFWLEHARQVPVSETTSPPPSLPGAGLWPGREGKEELSRGHSLRPMPEERPQLAQ